MRSLRITLLPLATLTTAYEIGFLGYEDNGRTPTTDDITWQTPPTDSTTCNHIPAAWVNNVEYAFMRTTPNEAPIPRFIGLYGNNFPTPMGCIHQNLNVIIKFEPDRGGQLQMADTLKRDLDRALERDYEGGHAAWRVGRYWDIDSDRNRLFEANEVAVELPQQELMDSDDESGLNFFDGSDSDDLEEEREEEAQEEEVQEEAEGSVHSMGSSRANSISTAESERFANLNSWGGGIQWPNTVLDALRNLILRQMQPSIEADAVPTGEELLDLDLGPPIGDIIDPAPSPRLDADLDAGEEGALRLMQEISDHDGSYSNQGTEYGQGNPLDELE
ncbi:hypothetical protein TWF481_000156 [Arthrobotrys musiformis]|uniref:Uncharacterized protein n=1 Tax=Arthrobotrys musiformis TaxID=47236 RepID=A0AAV9WMN6_9PEZI